MKHFLIECNLYVHAREQMFAKLDGLLEKRVSKYSKANLSHILLFGEKPHLSEKYQHNKYIFLAVQSFLCQTKRLVFDESNKPDNQADHHNHNHNQNNQNDPINPTQNDWAVYLFFSLLEHPMYVMSRASISDMISLSDFHYLPLHSKLLPWAWVIAFFCFSWFFHSHLDHFYHNRHDLATIIITIFHHHRHDLKSIKSFKQTRRFDVI